MELITFCNSFHLPSSVLFLSYFNPKFGLISGPESLLFFKHMRRNHSVLKKLQPVFNINELVVDSLLVEKIKKKLDLILENSLKKLF